ncbi:MAG: DUF3108 domain-containing protein [Gemmatimonadota bacterium]
MMRISVLVLMLLAAPLSAFAQDGSVGIRSKVPAAVPFGVGERFDYRVKFGPIKVGQAYMQVVGIDTIAGWPTYHLQSLIKGSTFFYKLEDKQDSWLDVYQLASRRYVQDSHQGDYERYRDYRLDLENLVYERNDGETDSIPEGALDDASFVYFVRSIPLEVGETYEWNRYFRWDRNPVILKVLRREKVKVPAGQFSTIVVRPIIKTGGLFSEGGEAEIYMTDDDRRLLVKLVTKLKVGSVILELTEYTLGQELTAEMLVGGSGGSSAFVGDGRGAASQFFP